MKLKNISSTEMRDIFMICMGMCIYSIGFCGFILPEKLVSGGLAGLTALIYYATDIPVAYSMYAINLGLLALALRFIGKQFVARTIIGATFISMWIAIFQPVFTEPIVANQTFMNVVVGGLICGCGLGLCFAYNGTSGGTDIVAALIQRYRDMSMGRALLCADFCVISSSWFVFHDLEKIVYGVVLLVIITTVSDMMINTTHQTMQFIIISKKWDQIADAINTQMRRGCTFLHGMGSYTRGEMNVVLVYCSKMERMTLIRLLWGIDKDAFLAQSNVAVYGAGFSHVKMKNKDLKASAKIIENYENQKRAKEEAALEPTAEA